MSHNTILTSKGTTTIPAAIRKQLGIKPGMYLSFIENKVTGEYVIRRAQTIEEVRSLNKEALKLAKTSLKQYESGDGFNQFIAERYGERK
jgi:AbrB family looped-hinge helix DNA binding protein